MEGCAECGVGGGAAGGEDGYVEGVVLWFVLEGSKGVRLTGQGYIFAYDA